MRAPAIARSIGCRFFHVAMTRTRLRLSWSPAAGPIVPSSRLTRKGMTKSRRTSRNWAWRDFSEASGSSAGIEFQVNVEPLLDARLIDDASVDDIREELSEFRHRYRISCKFVKSPPGLSGRVPPMPFRKRTSGAQDADREQPAELIEDCQNADRKTAYSYPRRPPVRVVAGIHQDSSLPAEGLSDRQGSIDRFRLGDLRGAVQVGDYTSIGFLTIIRGKEICLGSHVQIGSLTFWTRPTSKSAWTPRLALQTIVKSMTPMIYTNY